MATILSKVEAESLCKKILSYSKAETCEINILGEERGNLRYARNTVSTSGSLVNKNIAVQSSFGKRVGTATIDEFDEASLEKVVRRSEELARLSPESPEFVPPLTPQEYLESRGFVEATANASPATRAEAVAQSLELVRAQNLTAAGYLENYKGYTALMNSKGLFAYYPSTNVDFSLTVRTADGKGSGYATKGYNDIQKLDTAAASRVAIQKAQGSVNAKAIEPGKYTVILEPTAAAVLLENLFFNLDARSADEGRSFLSKPGGKTKLGEKLVDERIHIYSDPQHPELPTSPWAGDGRKQEKINWIEKGVIKNLTYSRYWAEKQGVKAVPPPKGFIMEGGNASLEDLIKGTDKGILVTRLWYIRTVDPQTLLLTGLTRDGTFYIENGKIAFPVKNFRFNESPVIMLNNLEAMGKPERTVSGESFQNYMIPPLKIRDFTFTSLSDAV
ncbi:peptidase C69 [Adhaeribacter arboris]|uniref:Peptidase C69 n=1 Tax=Adhaeribacter arboris TaxID=2072846 RepID=A0A2T2YK27_9BACT|nr:TldD/PmbA family protein [Adhaeribacter arboris]PSR55866.1 peptidase C69 [Adhaeribacter arboris]